MYYDVFNGDADGIFALHQLRLHRPVSKTVHITGVKRDINLLRHIVAPDASEVMVLDISLDKNRQDLDRLLACGTRVLYIDHHYAGAIPASPLLTHHIDPSPETCTSFIVNSILENQYPLWAACGGFGDNLHKQASAMARDAGATPEQIDQLKEIGELFNYNGYGKSEEDLHFHPTALLKSVTPFVDPLTFLKKTDTIDILRRGYDDDMGKAMAIANSSDRETHRIYFLPSEAWSRRISGVFSNMLARQKETAAHGVIIPNDDGSLLISVRAPLRNRHGADILCRQFPTGGGRAAAAGINNLPPEQLDTFIEAFYAAFPSTEETNRL